MPVGVGPQFLLAPHVVAASELVWTAPERMARAYAALLPLTVVPVPIDIAVEAVPVLFLFNGNGIDPAFGIGGTLHVRYYF